LSPRDLFRTFLGLASALVVLALPLVAWACPYCAGRRDGGVAQAIVLGSFVFFPFAVTWTVLRVIRSERPDEAPAGSAQAPHRERSPLHGEKAQ
jgi:hypothetical protein